MSSSLRRGALAAAAIAFSIASLAACGAGNNAQTLEIKPDQAATSVGDLKVQNAIVITQPDRESTGPAVVSATLFNNGDSDQTLDAVKVEGTGKTAEIHPAEGDGKLTVPAGGHITLGGEGNASAVLPSSREAIQDGNAQEITFSFSETGDVSLRALVVPAESYFTGWGPSDVPEIPDASASGSASPSGTPSDSASASADASASASASESVDPDTHPSGLPTQGSDEH
ncbi:copper chaperone PCu(A)C [Streptomyces poonensis]|uniref:DUF461 domain-containing protein n=1 Tax=Streptomyces poonensis TaxID=68255 RepID=A0A918UE75_9ACTN|nr:copper chaperone PCu(A)C [Streptomyces poonensis]GGY95660.1 hypothetical protein GCM10010365_13170 [Streptomyces poonensis]GLJ88848.1 hypothetical protein GCM10017589_14480 [Streptomyces poonensis]